MQARDSKGAILSQKEHIVKGKFSFMSEIFDTYEICFTSQVPKRKYPGVAELMVTSTAVNDSSKVEVGDHFVIRCHRKQGKPLAHCSGFYSILVGVIYNTAARE